MIITLLLFFLWFPNGNSVYLPRPPPLLDMKNLTWVTANLSYLLDNDILIMSYDNEVNALLSMHLFSPTINITSCTFLCRYIYYKGPILGKYLQEHLSDSSLGRTIYGSNLDEQCIAI